nr:hypothetical protein [Streptomyces sp. SID4985]
MDGRVLPVLLGPTGHPPKTYRIPVPDAAGGPPTVLYYRREALGYSKRLGLQRGWKYVYDPEGERGGDRLRWPWSKPAARPVRDGTPDSTPGNTPDGKPDDPTG